MTTPPLTTKQKREASRAAKVAELKRQQAAQKRTRRIGLILGIVGGVAVLSLLITFIVIGSTPKPNPDDVAIDGVKDFGTLTAAHVDGPVDYLAEYGMNPPAGGDHAAAWLNCGVYEQPQANENAVHSLEHGAVWVTYDPDALDDSEVQALRDAMPSTYSIVSPYPDLPAPVVASAWGVQVQLDGADDPRLASFISKYWKSASAPEPGAPCVGAIDGPGKVG